MQCINCKRDMDLKFLNNNPDTGFAYYVYECFECMIVCKVNFWKNPSIVWIYPDNNILESK